MSKSTGIIRQLESASAHIDNVQVSNRILADKILQRIEEEKEKTEDQKIHERFVRNIKRRGVATEVVIVPHRKKKPKPGLEFEGTIEKLIEKYKTIEEVWKHMTLGQLAKYHVVEGVIYETQTGREIHRESE